MSVTLLLWQRVFRLWLGPCYGSWMCLCECKALESLFILCKHAFMQQMAWLIASFGFFKQVEFRKALLHHNNRVQQILWFYKEFFFWYFFSAGIHFQCVLNMAAVQIHNGLTHSLLDLLQLMKALQMRHPILTQPLSRPCTTLSTSRSSSTGLEKMDKFKWWVRGCSMVVL